MRVEWILLLLREEGTRTSRLLDQTEGRGEQREDRRRGGCVDKEKMYPPGLHISNRFQALNDEDEPNLCPVEKQ